jgi:PAS domain S-box-containing protein
MALFKTKSLSKPVRKKQNPLANQNSPATGKTLTLRQKAVLVIGGTLVGLLGVLYVTSSTLLKSNIKVAEEQYTRQAVESVLSIFSQTKEDFSARFPDWSAWDDTYNFIKQGKPSNYIESNLTAQALASMKVNLVVYINSAGELVYATGLDIRRQQKIPLPASVKKHIAKGSLLLRSANRPEILTGILTLPSGPMLVTAQPILTSKGSGPMGGTVIFGRNLDTAKIQKLASRYRLTWQEINTSQLPADFLAARSYLLGERKNSTKDALCLMPNPQCPIMVYPLNSEAIAGYTIIQDIYGKPALLLRVEAPREIYQQGIANLHYLFAALAIAGLVFGAIAILLTEKLLASQRQTTESEVRYRAVIAQATDGIFLIDARSKRFLEANAALEKLLGYTLKEILQLTLYDVVIEQPEKLDRDIEHILTAEQHFTGEQQYRRRDGSILQAEIKANQIAYAKKTILCVVLRDISARKQVENARLLQSQKEQTINLVVQSLRNSLELNTIFSTAVSEIGTLLKAERATITEYFPQQQQWRCVAEHRQKPDLPISLGLEIPARNNWVTQRLKQLEIIRIDDTSQIEDEIVKNLAQTYPGSWLIIPLRVDSYSNYDSLSIPVWGTLNLLRHTIPAPWQDWEVELAGAIADQLAIAIQQSKLYQQIQQLNADLETQVIERTAELERSLSYEATLKRITDKVRDSLDESQILQTAVQELAISLGVYSCDAALYDLEHRTSTICYEYICPEIPSAKGLTLKIDDWPDIYKQLLQGHYVQYCFIGLPGALVRTSKLEFTILSCPLVDDRGILGDMWLFKPRTDYFSDLEIRLVQQVANQCAIAIRQARLYQATQAQVEELEKLNRLKDDFLSTVSHELRTPMSNIKMATQMLEVVLKQAGVLESGSTKIARYFKILHEECQRETNLINDLLDLSRLDAGAESLVLSSIDPKIAILQIAEVFVERIHSQQQQLEMHFPTQLPQITTDLSKLERIITELLNNACKYTPPGEKITITARVKDSAKTISENPETLLLSVKNSGVEIPPGEISRIFDKFYRIPNSNPWKHGGTGLGLALVQKLVTYLHGSIRVESANNEICFTVELPV